jgi:hypothetical protein
MFRKHPVTVKRFQCWFPYGFIGLLLVLWISSGCGNGDAGVTKNGGSGEPLQACELLTKADVEAILGGAVEEPSQMFKEKQKKQFWMSSCNYFAPATSRRAGILIQSSPNADPAKAFETHTASLKEALGEKYNLQPIDGVGARAAWDGSTKQLTLFEGPRMLIVSTGGPGEDEGTSLTTAKLIALKVLSKLPR